MKILVTGGAGFIGRHLVKFLMEKGNTVTIFDNFSNSSRGKILSLEECGVKVVEGDITSQEGMVNATKNTDVVVHLAAKISVSESVKNPLETFRVNVEGTRNVLNSCVKNNVKKLVVASSAAVYGEGSAGVKLTEKSPTNPISPYGESKLKMEEMIKEFVSNHDIGWIILRFFNIYGKGQSDEYAGVISKFANCVQQNIPLIIYGNGNQTRDFVSVYDVINSIHDAISNPNFGIYNIASGNTITIKELAESIIQISGKELLIKYEPPKKGDIVYSQADITHAEKYLKYHPKYEIKKEIKHLLEQITN